MTDHPFQPGVEVAIVSRPRFGYGVSYKIGKVARVYKTGKFILEGSATQYRASKSNWGDREWEARSTRSETIQFVTDKLKAEAAKTKLESRFRIAVDAISNLRGTACSIATEDHCEALERIVSELKAGVDS